MKTLRTWAPVALAGLALAACGADDAPPPTAASAPAAGLRAHAAALARTATPEQAPALRDGVVSDGEHAAATRAVHACLAAEDLPVVLDPLQPDAAGELHFGLRLKSRTRAALQRDERRVAAAFDRCQARHRSDVGAVWANQRVVPAAARPGRLARLRGCLQRAGVRVRDGEDVAQVASRMERAGEAAMACAEADPDLFRVPVALRPVDARSPVTG